MGDETKRAELRCSKVPPGTPHEGGHLALDILLPCSLTVFARVLKRMPRCACGAVMLVRGNGFEIEEREGERE